MKKIFFLAVVSIIGMSSCQYNVDKTNIYMVGEAIHESFIKKDTTILKQVFLYQMDSISEIQRNVNKEIQDFFTPELKVIQMDTSSGWWWNNLDLFYKKGSDFYRIRATYNRDSLGEISIDFLSLININEECEDYINTPYCPTRNIEFKNISWTTDYYGKTLKSGVVSFQNNTGNDLNYIKFRVILKHSNSSWSAETFFNQTVESYKPSYKGDITTVQVSGMENYYTGFKIEKDNMFFDAELIEVLPKPESDRCIKLEELKEKILNKSE